MPIPSVRPTGVTAIEAMVGAVTVREVDPEIAPNDAEILPEPAATPFTKPVALTVAIVAGVELQVTSDVKSALLPSV